MKGTFSFIFFRYRIKIFNNVRCYYKHLCFASIPFPNVAGFFFFFSLYFSISYIGSRLVIVLEREQVFRVDFRLAFISRTTTSPFHSGKFRPRSIRGVQGDEAPWLGRLGKVSLVRIVKNVVAVYSSSNSQL